MSTTSARKITVEFSGDIKYGQEFSAAQNTVPPAQNQIIDLASGANTITVPTGGSTVPTAVTIIPPSGNATAITLKGVTGDTGIALHITDPTSIGIASSVTTFVLTAGGAITGVRLIWS